MKLNKIPLICFAIISLQMVQTNIIYAQLPKDQIAEIAEKITVLIQSPGSPGSGIIINKRGNIYTVLTAAHVVNFINQGEEADVTTFDNKTYKINTNNIEIFADNSGNNLDLALVEFTSDGDYAIANLGDSSQLKRGANVYVAGFPIATTAINRRLLTFTSGELTAVASNPLADGYGIVYNNNTLPGMSGGPVLNDQGDLIGVHGKADAESTKATDDPNIRVKTGFNLAIPINTYIGLRQPRENIFARVSSLPTSDDYFMTGSEKYQQGDYLGAIADYNMAIVINPDYADAFNNRGAAFDTLDKHEEALADYNQALNINPNKERTYYNRGTIYLDLGNYEQAIIDYNQALTLNSNYVSAYNNRGLAYYNLGNYEQAISDYSQALQLNSNDPDIYNNRAISYYIQGMYEEARRDLEKARDLFRQEGKENDYQRVTKLLGKIPYNY